MENCQTGLKYRKTIFVLTGMLFFVISTGCQTVKMPNLSDLDLGLPNQKRLVTIKHQYDKVNIRPTPSTNQEPVAVLKGGDQVSLESESGNWLNVSFYDTAGEDQVGWIYKYLVMGYEKPPSGNGEKQPQETNEWSSEESSSEEKTKKEDISIL